MCMWVQDVYGQDNTSSHYDSLHYTAGNNLIYIIYLTVEIKDITDHLLYL